MASPLRAKTQSGRYLPDLHPSACVQEAFDLLEATCCSNQRPDFLLVHFPELDQLTHQYGTKSSKRRELVRKTDSMIAKAIEMLGEDSYVITFSDHGMRDVEGYIDIATKIKTLFYHKGDLVVFLDSIMARFWIFKDSIFDKIIRFLSEEISGRIILPSKANMIDRFGHIMFLCSPGYIIFPNYYDSRPPQAMHGYAPIPPNSPLNCIFLVNDLPVIAS